jgi:hypothetical protein
VVVRRGALQGWMVGASREADDRGDITVVRAEAGTCQRPVKLGKALFPACLEANKVSCSDIQWRRFVVRSRRTGTRRKIFNLVSAN